MLSGFSKIIYSTHYFQLIDNFNQLCMLKMRFPLDRWEVETCYSKIKNGGGQILNTTPMGLNKVD